MAGERIPTASPRYSERTLFYTPRQLGTGRKTAKVVADAAENTAQRAWAFRAR